MSSNATRTHLTGSMTGAFQQLPPSVLNAIIPGYSILEHVAKVIGVNISIVIFGFALVAGIQFGVQKAVLPFLEALASLICSRVVIDEGDPMYEAIVDWLQKQQWAQHTRTASLSSGTQSIELVEADTTQSDSIFNYQEWLSKAPFRYLPNSSGIFHHKGYLYRIDLIETPCQGFKSPQILRELMVTVFWPSMNPLKSLMEEIREEDLSTYLSRTLIYRPVQDDPSACRWRYIATRPSRPISTVELDHGLKESIVDDMNGFMLPSTNQWYSKRGIIYRRGYLFQGPPGCGKTSFAFSLAGLFGVGIYCLSLSDPDLTEERLMVLISHLPYRSMVLLEDIDSAGLTESNPQPAPPETGSTVRPRQPISFSCLLNAIDGVASPEGCVFILTTNHLDRLPPALIRPGRVDVSVEFGLAAKQQIKDLFIRMYSSETDASAPRPKKLSDIFPAVDPKTSDSVEQPHRSNEASTLSPREPHTTVDSELRSLADRFAQQVPAKAYNLASIQGFLLSHRYEPERAVHDIHDWLEKNPPATNDDHAQKKEKST
ncbi:uncharacterized protein PV06_08286 [Exophiala oligosperma]|uniref:AAA+ ATPase domain-containing protein n=1 Tax=Exophiala oligosperma TaxID=215243 RepID=A0A0D2BQ82_9EURO|nr:uncharacterized protein PV06_08286 [Exophiala oligosperma]KIW39697.1 hypothetical protein PV06_08286 [Exophiala oligosperma]